MLYQVVSANACLKEASMSAILVPLQQILQNQALQGGRLYIINTKDSNINISLEPVRN